MRATSATTNFHFSLLCQLWLTFSLRLSCCQTLLLSCTNWQCFSTVWCTDKGATFIFIRLVFYLNHRCRRRRSDGMFYIPGYFSLFRLTPEDLTVSDCIKAGDCEALLNTQLTKYYRSNKLAVTLENDLRRILEGKNTVHLQHRSNIKNLRVMGKLQ